MDLPESDSATYESSASSSPAIPASALFILVTGTLVLTAIVLVNFLLSRKTTKRFLSVLCLSSRKERGRTITTNAVVPTTGGTAPVINTTNSSYRSISSWLQSFQRVWEGKRTHTLSPSSSSTSPQPSITPVAPLVLVVNPKSGGGLGSQLAQVVTDPQQFPQQDAPAAVFPLTVEGLAEALRTLIQISNSTATTSSSSSSSLQQPRLVCAGGDGTVSAVVRELSERGLASTIPVAVLPLGTGNDVARSLGVGGSPPNIRNRHKLSSWFNLVRTKPTRDIDIFHVSFRVHPGGAIHILRHGEETALPEQEVRGTSILYTSIGIDARLVWGVEQRRTSHRILNQILYFLIGSCYSLFGWSLEPLTENMKQGENDEEIKKKNTTTTTSFAEQVMGSLQQPKQQQHQQQQYPCRIDELEVDGVKVSGTSLPHHLHSLLLVSSPSYAGGHNIWPFSWSLQPKDYKDMYNGKQDSRTEQNSIIDTHQKNNPHYVHDDNVGDGTDDCDVRHYESKIGTRKSSSSDSSSSNNNDSNEMLPTWMKKATMHANSSASNSYNNTSSGSSATPNNINTPTSSTASKSCFHKLFTILVKLRWYISTLFLRLLRYPWIQAPSSTYYSTSLNQSSSSSEPAMEEPWEPQSMQDGRIEMLGIQSLFQLSGIIGTKTGIFGGVYRLGQPSSVVIHVTPPPIGTIAPRVLIAEPPKAVSSSTKKLIPESSGANSNIIATTTTANRVSAALQEPVIVAIDAPFSPPITNATTTSITTRTAGPPNPTGKRTPSLLLTVQAEASSSNAGDSNNILITTTTNNNNNNFPTKPQGNNNTASGTGSGGGLRNRLISPVVALRNVARKLRVVAGDRLMRGRRQRRVVLAAPELVDERSESSGNNSVNTSDDNGDDDDVEEKQLEGQEEEQQAEGEEEGTPHYGKSMSENEAYTKEGEAEVEVEGGLGPRTKAPRYYRVGNHYHLHGAYGKNKKKKHTRLSSSLTRSRSSSSSSSSTSSSTSSTQEHRRQHHHNRHHNLDRYQPGGGTSKGQVMLLNNEQQKQHHHHHHPPQQHHREKGYATLHRAHVPAERELSNQFVNFPQKNAATTPTTTTMTTSSHRHHEANTTSSHNRRIISSSLPPLPSATTTSTSAAMYSSGSSTLQGGGLHHYQQEQQPLQLQQVTEQQHNGTHYQFDIEAAGSGRKVYPDSVSSPPSTTTTTTTKEEEEEEQQQPLKSFPPFANESASSHYSSSSFSILRSPVSSHPAVSKIGVRHRNNNAPSLYDDDHHHHRHHEEEGRAAAADDEESSSNHSPFGGFPTLSSTGVMAREDEPERREGQLQKSATIVRNAAVGDAAPRAASSSTPRSTKKKTTTTTPSSSSASFSPSPPPPPQNEYANQNAPIMPAIHVQVDGEAYRVYGLAELRLEYAGKATMVAFG